MINFHHNSVPVTGLLLNRMSTLWEKKQDESLGSLFLLVNSYSNDSNEEPQPLLLADKALEDYITTFYSILCFNVAGGFDLTLHELNAALQEFQEDVNQRPDLAGKYATLVFCGYGEGDSLLLSDGTSVGAQSLVRSFIRGLPQDTIKLVFIDNCSTSVSAATPRLALWEKI